jgi:SNF2 family DNA or RNA helicase
MKLLHGTWVPENKQQYIREGSFYLWAESTAENNGNPEMRQHPFSLLKKEFLDLINNDLNTGNDYSAADIEPVFFTIPAKDGEPLKSYELLKYTGEEAPEQFDLKPFRVDCCKIPEENLVKTLNELHFQLFFDNQEITIATDLLFWFYYTQSLKEIILKDQYIPYLKYRALDGKDNNDGFQIYPFWQIVSDKYEKNISRYAGFMPQACLSGAREFSAGGNFYEPENLLRHFSENLLKQVARNTKFPPKLLNQAKGTILEYFFKSYRNEYITGPGEKALELYRKWAAWKDNILQSHTITKFNLCFKLEEAKNENDQWQVNLSIAGKKAPFLKISLHDYWHSDKSRKEKIKKTLGRDLEKTILLHLGQAARIYPKIWEALETDKPDSFELDLEEAFLFLKETAYILEDSGYKVAVPEWWTPQARNTAKLRIKVSGGVGRVNNKLFTTENLIRYQYQLAIGDQEISEKEWRDLVNAKTPLVKFRGQWLEPDIGKMLELLELWQKNRDQEKEMSLLDLLKIAADESSFAVEHDKTLFEMMARLRDKNKFELVKTPEKFKGALREYQRRGVSWIQYLEQLGLNGCLADDMGLGKTIQVIARLINEKEENQEAGPTLLLAPTSVLGNWQKETERFAPHLRALIRHGIKRTREKQEFIKECSRYDLVITSYSLLKKDEELLKAVHWQRIVIDEAQNIKNPKAAQTKALLQLKANHRLALTGTPVENRLLDLWSIFNFLNHGYLDSHTAFRKTFEIPVQKDNNRSRASLLKNLVEPFILRRVKTDKNIIKDLPDKVEQLIYCNLTKEQGSLYEAVVRDIEKQLEEKEGIERKGLILSSLMRLKQICNHPVQFLQDGSEFSAGRSHKLSRLSEMLEEVIENGDSVLVFSQFREICQALSRFIGENLHYRTYLLHGGTTRNKRQKMIDEFQDPETEPAVFILSLKAGGVGINLTKASHVFHFDRWWNPAVEDQATDRAFRIGQRKNVFVHKFLAIGTLEEKINQLIEDKKKLSGIVIGSDESWLTELDNAAFKKLIALNKNAVLE